MAAFHSQKQLEVSEGLLRHLILNTIRGFNVKYRAEYGQMILAVDSGSWRKNVFPEYKAARRKNREESKVDWSEVFSIMHKIVEEVRENIPWVVLKVNGAEADDIIGTLVLETQEFGKHEKVMIVSNDKDFAQLHRFKNVSQFSPMKQKLITVKDPVLYLKEQILTGDTSDGVPNFLSDNKAIITEGVRQTPLSAKRKAQVIENWKTEEGHELLSTMTEQEFINFQRNQKMVDLTYTPTYIKDAIIEQYESYKKAPNLKVMNYLVKNRCKNLISSASEFFPHKK